MSNRQQYLASLLLISIALIASTRAYALEVKNFCIYDPVGKNGPSMTFFSDFVPKAIGWGLDVKLNAYTDEKVAANDFKGGICEAVFVTAILSRQFVPFGGTLDSVGGIIGREGLNKVVNTLTNPKMAEFLVNGPYEMVGSFPVGAVYFFVNDRKINTMAAFAGKKMSILNEDPQSYKLANLAGSSPVGTSLSTFSGQFNNGNIDILPMVALGYDIFELYHGLGEKGGIIDYKVTYGMMQVVSYREKFATDFGQKMREYILSRMNDVHKMVADAEAAIPAKYWIKTDDITRTEMDKFNRIVRAELTSEGVNHPKALTLLWKIRCSEDPSRAECGTPE